MQDITEQIDRLTAATERLAEAYAMKRAATSRQADGAKGLTEEEIKAIVAKMMPRGRPSQPIYDAGQPIDSPAPQFAAKAVGQPQAVGSLNGLTEWALGAKAGRIEAEYRVYGGKALGSSTDAAGGYLVPPTYSSEIAELIRGLASMAQIVSNVQTSSFPFFLSTVASGTQAAWVAELGQIPETSMAFSQIVIDGFTAAALVKVSNQLLRQSRPAADQVVSADLASELAHIIDNAALNGTGSGQPKGILATPGVGSMPTTGNILEDIRQASANAFANSGVQPTHVVMHPRRYSVMLGQKDGGNRYILDALQTGQASRIWGLQVVLDPHIPTDLGAGANEDVLIVGAFKEAYLVTEQSLAVDVSNEAGDAFATNSAWFRAVTNVGFAVRRPPAFVKVTGYTAG